MEYNYVVCSSGEVISGQVYTVSTIPVYNLNSNIDSFCLLGEFLKKVVVEFANIIPLTPGESGSGAESVIHRGLSCPFSTLDSWCCLSLPAAAYHLLPVAAYCSFPVAGYHSLPAVAYCSFPVAAYCSFPVAGSHLLPAAAYCSFPVAGSHLLSAAAYCSFPVYPHPFWNGGSSL